MTPAPSLDPADRPTRIAVLVDHERNRGLLADHFEGSFEVTTDPPADGATVDCFVVDEAGLDRHRATVETALEGAAPVFVPVLLVAHDPDRLPESVRSVADEVVGTPIDPGDLDGRLEVLLRTREHSRRLEGRRKRSEERFRSLFETAPDPVLVVEADGTVVDANAAFVALVGRTRADLVDTDVLDVGFEPAGRVERVLLRAESGTPEERTLTFVDPDGGTHVVEVNAAALEAGSGADRRIATLRDVTEREESRRGMERKIERLDEFASIVSHDLRNPLTIAKGNLQIAATDCEAAELDTVADSLDRMERLIERLLDFARAGTVVTEPTAVSLAAVSNRAFDLIEDVPDVTLDVATDAVVFGDEGGLRRIFDNLFRNAIEHADPPVAIRVGRTPDGFFVEDDGPGIPESEREDVLSMGYTTEDGGSGLGLSIVADVTEAHGWSLTVEAGADGGARFVFGDVDFVE